MSPISFSRRLSKKWVILMLLSGLLVSSVIGYLGCSATSPLSYISNMFYDAYQKSSASGETASNTVIIDIDASSLEAAGQWPWPRYRVATLIQAIAQMKPAAIGLDIIFSEEDRTALTNIRKAFKQDFGLDISFADVPPALTDNDGYLGSVLSETGAVGAKYFYFDHASKVEVSGTPAFKFSGRTDLLSLHDAQGVLDNTYKISSQLKYAGFINSQPDDDGMLRKLPLLIQHKGVLYPHLSLATFMRSQGETRASIEESGYGPVIQVGSYRVPISENGFALLRFNGLPHLYPSISALNVLNGSISESLVRDKVVFVGSSAAGLKDLHHTVFDAQLPGVKTLAVMVENFFEGNATIEPAWAGLAIFAGCMLSGIITSLLFIFISNTILVLSVTVLMGSFVVAGSFGLFKYAGIFLTPAPCITIILLLLTLFSSVRFAIGKRHSSIYFRQLAEVRRVVNETLDEAHITRMIAEAACEILECTSASVGLLRDGEVVFSEYLKGDEIRAINYSFPPGHGVSGNVLQTNQAYISNDARHDKHVTPEIWQELGFKKLINVPVLDNEGKLIACLEIHDRLDGTEFDGQDIEMLENLSGIVASALVNARLLENKKRNEQEIAIAAERLNRILDADFNAVIAHQDFRVVYANRVARKMFGYPSLEQTLGKNPLDYVSETYRHKAMLAAKAVVRRGKSIGPIEIEALHPKTGEAFPIEIASTSIVWKSRPAIVSIVSDITERKAREEEMRLLESAVASISESVIITDAKGEIVYVNPSFTDNTGYSAQEVLGKTPAILNSQQQSNKLYNRLWETINAGQLWRGRIQCRKKDDTIFPVHISAAPIFNVKGEATHFVCVYEDLSENEELQKKMMQMQKMDAVGTMVGGLAHDFNNLLASMVGNLYLMRDKHEDDEMLIEHISSMEKSIYHAADIIKQMLTFARRDRPEKHAMEMCAFIEDAYKLAHAALPENISSHLICPVDEHIWIKGDATQLQQVVLNLVTNASHAVKNAEKPEIVLELDQEAPSTALLVQNPEADSESSWCRVRCSDNGCGINGDALEHVFEPFFTTKEVGEGTGLGLAMAYGAMQNHHGIINVESTLGQGTTVAVWLPVNGEETTLEVVTDEMPVNGRGKTVLLVDDEENLRDVLAEVLRSRGFLVLLVSDGEQAVEVFRNHQTKVDLVLMDVVMPNKGGLLAANEIREINADVPIIFQTGYGEQTQHETMASISNSSSLLKPVQIPELLKKIFELTG